VTVLVGWQPVAQTASEETQTSDESGFRPIGTPIELSVKGLAGGPMEEHMGRELDNHAVGFVSAAGVERIGCTRSARGTAR